MVWIAGGRFLMGSDNFYPEERPVHPVTVRGFHIDRYPVTNRAFEMFIAATGYVTVAERPLNPADYPGVPSAALTPGSLVFEPRTDVARFRSASDWWDYVPGANWRQPEGPGSSLAGREDDPVVHVAYEDAESYATWAGKSLPTEAQWEYAARGGFDGAPYSWGQEFRPDGAPMANTWDGDFPLRAAHARTPGTRSAVGGYPPNGYGLHDMIGNVWEWTSDWFSQRHENNTGKCCCGPAEPRGGAIERSYDPAQPRIRIPRKVVKGGSFLCAPNYCQRYRPAARQPQMIDTSTCHIGFRCVALPS